MQLFVKDKNFYKTLLMLALPIIGQAIINQGVNMMDTIMLGSLGEIVISGSSLANQYYMLFTILHFGIGGGASVMTGQFWGRGELDNIHGVLALMTRISLFIALVMSSLSFFCGEQIMSIFTPDPAIIEAGAKYLKILSFGYIIHGFALIFAIIYRTVRLTQVGFLSSLISFFFNIFFNWIFIFGELGAPKMGIEGAALGTVLARVAEFLIVFLYAVVYDKKLSFRIRHFFIPVRKYIHSFIRRGAPVIISDAVLGVGNMMLAIIIGQLGATVTAAYSITAVLVQFCNVFAQGIAGSSSVMAANRVGAGEGELAQKEGITLFSLSCIIGLIAGVIIWIACPIIVDFYNVTIETKQIATNFIHIMCAVIFFQSADHVLTKGVLRGGGDTKFLMIADVLFLWCASIPLGALTGLVWGLDPAIVFFCLKIDLIIKSILCLIRLISGKWIHIVRVTD